MCCTWLSENTGRKKSPFSHHRTTLSACILTAKACIDDRKKLLNIDTSSTRPDNMVNFGLLTAEISWRVWGTPTHFNTFHILAALLHGTLVVGVSQTLRRWTEGTTLYLAGRPSCWALAHISSWCWLTQIDLEKWPLNGCLSGSCGEVIISTITWCPFSVELHWNECFYCFWQ